MQLYTRKKLFLVLEFHLLDARNSVRHADLKREIAPPDTRQKTAKIFRKMSLFIRGNTHRFSPEFWDPTLLSCFL